MCFVVIVDLLECVLLDKFWMVEFVDCVVGCFVVVLFGWVLLMVIVWWWIDLICMFVVIVVVLVVSCLCVLLLVMLFVLVVVSGVLVWCGVLVMCGYVIESLVVVMDVLFDKIGMFIEGCLCLLSIEMFVDVDVEYCFVLVCVME